MRDQLKKGYVANGREIQEIVAEWFPLEDEVWQRQQGDQPSLPHLLHCSAVSYPMEVVVEWTAEDGVQVLSAIRPHQIRTNGS